MYIYIYMLYILDTYKLCVIYIILHILYMYICMYMCMYIYTNILNILCICTCFGRTWALYASWFTDSCALHCVYLFICLLFVCLLFACVFAFYLFLRSCFLCHTSIMWFTTVGRRGWSRWLFLWSCLRFWWVSSGLFCSLVGLMQDVMKSLPSFLTYCYYCLHLFILKYTFCV